MAAFEVRTNVPYAVIGYGNRINTFEKTADSHGVARFEWPDFAVYVNAQKTDYFFSDKIILQLPAERSWGQTSGWYLVNRFKPTKELHGLHKSDVPSDEDAVKETELEKIEKAVTRVTATVRTVPSVPYTNIKYGNDKHGPFETSTGWSGVAQISWPLVYGKLFVNAQKSDYVFSNFELASLAELPIPIPVVGEPPSLAMREPTWGASSSWFLVSLTKRSIVLFALPRSVDPKIAICDAWDTAAKMDVPAELSTRFPISISDAMWICKEDPSITELLTDVSAVVNIEGYSFSVPITNGRGWVNLGPKPEISRLIASLVPPLPSSIPLDVSIPNKTDGFTSWSYSIKLPTVWTPITEIPIEFPVEVPIEFPVEVPVERPVVIPTISKTLIATRVPSSVFTGDTRTLIGAVDVGGLPVTGEPVVLKVDGVVVDETVTSNGVFVFEYLFDEAGSRKLVFESPATSAYPDYGRDVKRVSVSSVSPDIAERARIEHEEYIARREALAEKRIIIPEFGYEPIFRRDVSTVPAVEIPFDESEIPFDEPEVQIPTRGSIHVDLPIPPVDIPLIEIPVAVWVDNVFKGNAPITVSDIKVGPHSVVLKMAGFNSPVMIVEVNENEVSYVTGVEMIPL